MKGRQSGDTRIGESAKCGWFGTFCLWRREFEPKKATFENVSWNQSNRSEPSVAKTSPDKIDRQIQKAGLPTGGQVPFVPRLDKNRKGEAMIRKATVQEGPRRGKRDSLTHMVEFGLKTGRMQETQITGMSKRTLARHTSESM